jgi:hypothetical protein
MKDKTKTKVCTKCKQRKSVNGFTKVSKGSDKLRSHCKSCVAKNKREHYKNTKRSKHHYILKTYERMSNRVKGHHKNKRHLYLGLPICSREEFYRWAMDHEAFHKLWDEWKKAGMPMKLKPSIDRIIPESGYVLYNMDWLTHSENSRLGVISRWRSL